MKQAPCLRWQDHTPRSLAALAEAGAVAVLPLAAIEQHGEHLPLSTDLDISLGLVAAATAQLRSGVLACVLPPLAIGMSQEHTHFRGTLSLSARTALAAVTEIGESVARAGFRRRGFSRALASAAVDFARRRGASALEGYPMITHPGHDIAWGELHVGSRSIFAAAGFSEVHQPTLRRVVMRIDF